MKLIIDRLTKKLSAVAAGSEEIQTIKAGQEEPLRLSFISETTRAAVALASGSTILVSLKTKKDDTTYVASCGTFTTAATEHVGWLDLDNDAANAIYEGDEVFVEVKWTESGHTERSDDLKVKISKAASSGGETAPVDGSAAVIADFLFAGIVSADDSVTITKDAENGTIDLSAAAGSGGTWGSITGTLSSQADLQAALDAKSATSHTHTGLSVQAAGTASVRVLGTGATDACAGNDSRLSDSRTPTAHDQAWSTITGTPTTLSGYGITNGVPTGAYTASGLTMATARLLGRTTASTGAAEEITIGSGLSLSAGVLSSSSSYDASAVAITGGTITGLTYLGIASSGRFKSGTTGAGTATILRNYADSADGNFGCSRADIATIFATNALLTGGRLYHSSSDWELWPISWSGAANSGLHLNKDSCIVWSDNASSTAGSNDLFLRRGAANTLSLGTTHATTATNQTIKAHNVTTGTGADLILKGGTGSVANGNVCFGTFTTDTGIALAGYITIKDEAGTTRKLAVFA